MILKSLKESYHKIVNLRRQSMNFMYTMVIMIFKRCVRKYLWKIF